jgi:hypothetical protein
VPTRVVAKHQGSQEYTAPGMPRPSVGHHKCACSAYGAYSLYDPLGRVLLLLQTYCR